MTSTAQTGRAKEGNLIGIKGRYFPADTRIDTLDDPTLARLIVRHEKPLTLDVDTTIEPISVRKNKN